MLKKIIYLHISFIKIKMLMMKLFFRLRIGLFILGLSLFVSVYPQNGENRTATHSTNKSLKYTISGTVYSRATKGKPVGLELVSIYLPDLMMGTNTNNQGVYTLKDIPEGKVRILIRSLGYVSIDTTVNVKKDIPALNFTLVENNFRVAEVVVTARASKTGQSTASMISRTAMDHMQTSSLADLMQLLPGGSATNPNLSSASTINIRSFGDIYGSAAEAGALNMNSLGTAIIMDGSPVSGNANMQSINSVISGDIYTKGDAAVGGGLAPNSGVDLRQISTDNIESVEVIRGIPSVEYGDLTSGAVIVNSKAGKEPLSVRFKTNPNVYQFAANKGLSLGKNAGNLNLGADYAYNVTKPTEAYKYYQRITAKALYSNVFADGKWRSNTSLDFIYGKNTMKPNPDNEKTKMGEGARDIGGILNTNGIYYLNRGWFKSLKYALSGTYMDRHSYYQQQYSNTLGVYTLATQDGAITSNRPGTDVYDGSGNKITNWTGDKNTFVTMLPDSYFGRYDIYGKEVNVFAKLQAQFSGEIGMTKHRILLGADFKTDGNLGEGQVFDPMTPPKNSIVAVSNRPRKYKDIPFVSQVGVYIEENMTWTFAEKRNLNIQAGLRYDNVLNFKDVFSPRINMSLDILPQNALSLRGGWGITAKAPTVGYLYPDYAYFDFVNYNGMTNLESPANQQFAMVTTRAFDSGNKDRLEIAKNYKSELSFESRIGKMFFSLTGYYEHMRNGYSMSATRDTWKCMDYRIYEAVPGTGSVSPLKLSDTKHYLASYLTPSNNITDISKGLELSLDFGRVKAIRTSFSLTGAYMNNIFYENGETFFNKNSGLIEEYHVGIYEPKAEKFHRDRLITTLRATHNIPVIGLVITLTAQMTWMEREWSTFGNDSIPVRYMDASNGGMIKNFSMSEFNKLDPQSHEYDAQEAILKTKYAYRFRKEVRPPLLLVNINITKEFKKNLRVSFFANNMFMSYPVYKSKINPGEQYRRNPNIYFGIELAATIK